MAARPSLPDETRAQELRDRRSALITFALCRARTRMWTDAVQLFTQTHPRATQHLDAIEKAVAPALTTGDFIVPALGTALTVALDQQTIAGRMGADLATTPFDVHITTLDDDDTLGSFGDPGTPIPVIGPVAMAQPLVPVKRVGAILVETEEASRIPGATALVERRLLRVVARTQDEAMLTILLAGKTAVGGGQVLDSEADALAVVSAVRGGSPVVPYWVTDAYGAQYLLSLSTPTAGLRLFPDATLSGGSIFGAPLLVTDAPMAAGKLILIDAAAVVQATGTLSVDAAKGVALEQRTDPSNASATGTATALVSMFQTNAIALRVTRAFNVVPAVDDAAAFTDLPLGSPV
jgi:hypothetical protein